MAIRHKNFTAHTSSKKTTSQGSGGRSRRVKIGLSNMNKSKRASHKKYRGQGR
jgi:hypothetical protein